MEEIQKIAEENFATWNGALLSREPARMASLYAEDCSFLPTMAGDLRRGRERAENYFGHFMAKNPSGTVIESAVHNLGGDQYLHVGLYDFEVDGADGSREVVQARFTYLWRQDGDAWRIVHHHSSVRP